jgi:hypothetical protein
MAKMTTKDVVETILNEMGVDYKYHEGGSWIGYVVKPSRIWVFIEGLKLVIVGKGHAESKEIDLHLPDSIQEIKTILHEWAT